MKTNFEMVKSRLSSKISWSSLALGCALSLTACLGSQRHSPLGGVADESPYVETYVEYSGPSDRWAGPVSFLLHITARDGEKVKYEVSPVSFFDSGPEAIEVIGRLPASSLTVRDSGVSATGGDSKKQRAATHAEIRERFAALAEVIETSQESFRACLYPVRVRMIRQDGGLKEWAGCRASSGWPKAVSEFTDRILNGAV